MAAYNSNQITFKCQGQRTCRSKRCSPGSTTCSKYLKTYLAQAGERGATGNRRGVLPAAGRGLPGQSADAQGQLEGEAGDRELEQPALPDGHHAGSGDPTTDRCTI